MLVAFALVLGSGTAAELKTNVNGDLVASLPGKLMHRPRREMA